MSRQFPRCIAPTGAQHTRFREKPRYAEGLWDLGNDLYAWMVPNGSWGEANAGLVMGDGASLLVDTLWDLRHTLVMLDGFAPLLEKSPLAVLVNTHADGDHFWGNQLIDANVRTITSDAARDEMDHHKPASMLKFGKLGKRLKHAPFRTARRVGHWFDAMCIPYRFDEVKHTPARETFSGTEWLDIGGRKVQLIEVGPAHTLGDLMVYVPDAKTLYAGDILFIGSTPVIWAGPVGNWIKALDLILDLDVETIVPGHGPLTDKDGVRQVKTYWEYLHGAALRCFESKTKPAMAARQIVESDEFRSMPFIRWDSPERIMTNVHLLYREFQGKSTALNIPAKVNLMRKQALLAHRLPDATPKMMRREEASL